MGLPDERGVEDGAVLSGAALNLVGPWLCPPFLNKQTSHWACGGDCGPAPG